MSEYVYVEFPKFLFHPTKAPDGRIVNTPEEQSALGPGWFDTPADFDKPKPGKPAPATKETN